LRSRALLFVAVALANTCIVVLAVRQHRLQQALTAAETRATLAESRLEHTAQVGQRAIDALDPHAPDEARTLRVRLKLATRGDLELLEPTQHLDLYNLFDEML
jgi:hypothetical protein